MNNNKLILEELNDYEFKISTNYSTQQFHISSFNFELLNNLYFAHVIKESILIEDILIKEIDNKLYFSSSAYTNERINIDNNELLLNSLEKHPDFTSLKHDIKKTILKIRR